jgi:WD40 repeat protein/serine/threonine protein kinase
MNDKVDQHRCISCGDLYLPQEGDTGLCPECALFIVQSSPVVAVRSRTSPSEPVNSEIWQEGQTLLDTYEVKGELGHGEFGTVYRVHHKTWNIDLALKQPKPDVAARAGVETFVNEAQAWVDLGLHPHITTCYYVRNIEELPCVFAELVKEGSLADWIKKGKLRKLEDMLDVAIQFAWGLHYAHELGMVHQDVKPANVLMKEDGTTKVTDFGLVKGRMSGRTIFSGTGTILAEWSGGTQAYFSPEQSTWIELAGQAQQWAEAGEKELSDKLLEQIRQLPKPTRRTDLWSWGVCVLEIFNGERTGLYGSAAGEALKTYLANGPAVVGLSAMPTEVGVLLGECFQENPDDRPHDLQVVAERLVEVYREAVGKPYFRTQPKAIDLRADSLNNKALSLLDLGKEDQAVDSWQEALEIDPHHTEATYNLGLWRWQAAQQTDLELVQQLEGVIRTQTGAWMPNYLLGLVHIQRRDVPAARQYLEWAEWQSPGVEQALVAIRRLDEVTPVSPMGFPPTLEGHTGGVEAVAITPDGQQFVSGSEDKTLRVWNLARGECLRTLEGHTGGVEAVAITPDGRQVVSGSWDETLRVWDLSRGECLRTLEGHKECVSAVAITPDGRQVVSGSWDETLRVWDLASGECLRTLEGHTNLVEAVAISPDGRQVVSVSTDKTLRVWGLGSGECLRTLEGHTGGVEAVAITPDGRQVVSVSTDKTLRVWGLESGECLRTLEGHKSEVFAVAISPDGRQVVSGSWDKTLRVWDLESGECLRTLEGHKGSVSVIAITPDGRHVVSGESQSTLKDTTLQRWQLSAIYQKTVEWAVCRPRDVQDVQAAAVTVQRRLETARLALQSGQVREAAKALREALRVPGFERDSAVLALWHAAGRRAGLSSGLLWVHIQHTLNDANRVKTVAITPDGRHVVSGSEDNTLRVWNLASGECLRILEGHSSSAEALAITPDGRQFVSGSEDTTLRVWGLARGECLRTLEGHMGGVEAVAISPDGRHVVSGSWDRTLRVWDLESGECLHTLEGHKFEVDAVAITPDGRQVVSGDRDETMRVWSLESGECLRTLEGQKGDVAGVNVITITPDGRQVVSGSAWGTLQVWDLASGECLHVLAYISEVNALAITPDGRQVVSGSEDKTLRVWDLASGECLCTLQGHTAKVYDVAISPDGLRVVSGSEDTTLRVWDLDWDYEFPDLVDWDEGARPYLEIFLTLHTPYGPDGFTRRGKPTWTEEDFQQFLVELGYRGYGWLRSEGVRRKLDELMQTWEGP